MTGPSVFYDGSVLLTHGATMEHWHVDPVSGMMISLTSNGAVVAVPGRPLFEYEISEVEYVTYVTRPSYPGTTAGNPRR